MALEANTYHGQLVPSSSVDTQPDLGIAGQKLSGISKNLVVLPLTRSVLS